MKTVVVALIVAAVTVYAAPYDQYASWNECLADMNITNDELRELYLKKDPKVHCFVSCRYEKEGILVDGKLHKDVMGKLLMKLASKISEPEFNRMYDSCLVRTEALTDMCDITNLLSDCIHDGLVRAGV